jgi:hypothetical protein
MSKFRKSGGFDERYKGGKESNQVAGIIGAIIALFLIIPKPYNFIFAGILFILAVVAGSWLGVF